MYSISNVNPQHIGLKLTFFFSSFRLYPVIPANARVIAEKDIQVGDYLIPKNVSQIDVFLQGSESCNFVMHPWSNRTESKSGIFSSAIC